MTRQTRWTVETEWTEAERLFPGDWIVLHDHRAYDVARAEADDQGHGAELAGHGRADLPDRRVAEGARAFAGSVVTMT